MLIIVYAEFVKYAFDVDCRYAECHGASPIADKIMDQYIGFISYEYNVQTMSNVFLR